MIKELCGEVFGRGGVDRFDDHERDFDLGLLLQRAQLLVEPKSTLRLDQPDRIAHPAILGPWVGHGVDTHRKKQRRAQQHQREGPDSQDNSSLNITYVHFFCIYIGDIPNWAPVGGNAGGF